MEIIKKDDVLNQTPSIQGNKEVLKTQKDTKSKMMGWKMDVKDCKNNGCLINFN